jgi:hypothetical protein
VDENSLTWVLRRHWVLNAAHTLLVSTTAAGQSILNDPATVNQLFTSEGKVPARVANTLGFDGPPAGAGGSGAGRAASGDRRHAPTAISRHGARDE